MPYPTQVDRETIIAQAWTMIEAEGVENLSLSHLAAALGVKAPSLYRHIGNKAGLIQAVNLLTLQKLFQAFATTTAVLDQDDTLKNDAETRITAIFTTYRTFAHQNPNTYMLALINNDDAHRPDERILERMVLPIQAIMAQISGPDRALSALRGALALTHGFVLLELNSQLRRGGDLNNAFLESIKAYLRGWRPQT